MKADLLELMECPATGSALQLREGELISGSGNAYPIIQGMPRFYDLTTTDQPEIDPVMRESGDWSSWRRDCYNWLAKNLEDLAADASLLDLGAGPGQFVDLTRRFKAVTTDFAPYPEIDFVTDLTKRLPIKSEVFDVVVLSNVLEHLPEPHRVVKEVFRVLKPGGRMIAMTPFMFKLHQTPYDFLRYTRFMFEYLFRETGFERWEVVEMGHPASVFGATFKTWRKDVHVRFEKEGRKLRHWQFRMLEKIALSAIRAMQALENSTPEVVNKKRKKRLVKAPEGYGTVAWKPN